MPREAAEPYNNGNGRHEEAAPQEQGQAGAWLFGPPAANGNSGAAVPPQEDPVLPSFIELSMFQDPHSPEEVPDDQAEEQPEMDEAQAAWMAPEAWPSPVETADSPQASEPPPARPEAPGEPTVLMERSWFQEEHLEQPPVEDWTASSTPWPGETRRPVEQASWSDEPPAARPRQARPEPPAEDPWAKRRQASPEPPAEPPAEDPWIRQQRQVIPLPPAEEPRIGQQQPQPPTGGWVQQERPVRKHDDELSSRSDAWARANPPDHIDGDWEPLTVRLGLEDEAPAPDPIARAAARLKAARQAIKVEHGVAFVLVDDEGRPVLR